MPPKQGDADLRQETKMQAIVLADSFAKNFRLVTLEMPKMLMPLASLPMIEYTLEFLATAGVQEVFIFCCSHGEQIQRYVRDTQLERRLGTLKLHVTQAQGQCYSAGDALREVEALGVIKSDFVLVPGDVVANMQLAPVIAAHKTRRETQDRDTVLTTLMKRVPPHHRSRRAGEHMIVALAGETGRLLLYEEAILPNVSNAGCRTKATSTTLALTLQGSSS